MGKNTEEINSGATKIPVGLSFSGKKGREAFEIIKECGEDGYNKSTLVVDLLLAYGEAKKVYGDKAIYFLMACAMGIVDESTFSAEQMELFKNLKNRY